MTGSLAVLLEHVQDIYTRRLVDYALRYGMGSVAKRLGWSLEQAGVANEIIDLLLALPTVGVCILDPTQPHRGPW